MKKILLILMLSNFTHASDLLQELDNRNKSDVSQEGGSNHEMQIIQEFWGDAKFMIQCMTPNSPVHDPFDIYIEILPNGKANQIVFTSNDKVTNCILINVKDKSYPAYKKPFVAKIEMNFTQ